MITLNLTDLYPDRHHSLLVIQCLFQQRQKHSKCPVYSICDIARYFHRTLRPLICIYNNAAYSSGLYVSDGNFTKLTETCTSVCRNTVLHFWSQGKKGREDTHASPIIKHYYTKT